MVGFTQSDIEIIRRKAAKRPDIIKNILDKTLNLHKELHIQKSGLATWGHYYMCPYDTVSLKFDYSDSKNHKCPVCGRIFCGEPYDGAWWRIVLGMNADACFELAAAYLCTGEERYIELPRRILHEYADNYQNYEIHGDIPYNNPGRLASQVLCEALIINKLASGYALIKDKLSADEVLHIEKDLLLPSAEHLKKYMTPQIHNHEVIICVAIGTIGLVIGDNVLCEFAVNGKYGLKYQLDHALLSDGAWFEMSIGYHFFALRAFVQFEYASRYTSYSLLSDEHYRGLIYKMIEYAYSIRMPDNSFPKLNDGSTSYAVAYSALEYLHAYFKTDLTENCLNLSISENGRNSIFYLLYGAEKIAEHPVESQHGVYLPMSGSNLCVISDNDSYFLLKSSPFGGEHDHYDRMSISYSPFGSKASVDLGTASGYGAPLHYSYYKNTATHNTAVINGDNMPPCETKILKAYAKDERNVYVKAEARWDSSYVMPDSFTIKQWVSESYEGAVMRRSIRWYGDYFVDIFEIKTENDLEKDWIWHVSADVFEAGADSVATSNPWQKNPMNIFHDVKSIMQKNKLKLSFGIDGGFLDIHAFTSNKDVFVAKGPDNPSTTDIFYVIERSFDKSVVFVNVIEAYKVSSKISKLDVNFSDGLVDIRIEEKTGRIVAHNEELI